MEITNEVLAERIGNLSELVKDGFLRNAEEHTAIRESLQDEISDIKNTVGLVKKDVREIQDWRLIFVTKFTVYSTLALFIGTIISQLLIKWSDKIFNW